MKKIIIILVTSIVAYILYKATALMKWYNALIVDVKPDKSIKIENGNIILKTKVRLDNPKGTSITITKPTVRIYHNTVLLANSEPSNAKVKILANAITEINYNIKIPISGNLTKILLSSGGSIYNQIMSGSLTNLKLGLNLDSIVYMQIYMIEREWKEKISI